MKAKTINSLPHGWDTCIYDNEDYPTSFYYLNLPSKERADEFTNSFNSALSAHVAKETAPLQAEIDRLKRENKKLIRELKVQRELYIEVYEDRRRLIKNLHYDD